MARVEHHGRSTAYVHSDHREGPRVLYVHGSGGSRHVWANQYAPSGPVHPAAALDLSGHGKSADIDDETAVLDAYVRDVVAVADAVAADVLVGSSLGGALVLKAVIEAAFDPTGIVMAGSGGHLPVDGTLRRLLTEDFEGAIDLLHGADCLFHDAADRTVSRSKATMRAAGQAVARRDFLACDAFDVRDRLHEIDVPALAVVGRYDRLTPPPSHRTLETSIPGCHYREIPDAAHLAMVEQPVAFNEVLAGAIDRWD